MKLFQEKEPIVIFENVIFFTVLSLKIENIKLQAFFLKRKM